MEDKRTISGGAGPLRFGIMCNGTTFPSWQATCISKLLALDRVEVALLIIDNEYSETSANLRRLKNLRRLLWNVYRFFVVKPLSKAERPVDMSSVLGDVPSMRCTVIRKGRFSEYFTETDVSEIRKHDLDFILRFGFNIIRGDILKVPRFGVWSFHHDDEEKYRGSPPAFWEVYTGDHVTGAILQRLTNRLDAGIVLKKGLCKTISSSYVRNRDSIFFESADWPARVCVDIRNGAADYLSAQPSETRAHLFYAPNNVQMLVFIAKLVRRFLGLLRVLVFYDRWNIGIVNQPIHAFLTPGFRPEVRWLPAPPISRFSADPFAVRLRDGLGIVFEDYDYGRSSGTISAASLREGSSASHHCVIASPVHMAYPYLLEQQDEIYCIPETCEANEVGLWKALEFPRSWEKVATLIMGFAGVDNTVFHYEGRWWLLCTDDDDGACHKLKAWYAEDLFGPWTAHAANPIKVDIRSARSAGTPFVYGGQLYRPAQDCSRVYGGRVVINRVVRLTPAEFKEEPVVTVEPFKDSPYPDGIHTLSAAGGITVIDSLKKDLTIKSLSAMRHKVRRMIEVGRRAPIKVSSRRS